nr:cyclophilin-like family protein [Streptomyces sp. MJM1172]
MAHTVSDLSRGGGSLSSEHLGQNTWGEEVSFDTGVRVALEPGGRRSAVVGPGTVALRTEGNALALPYGPTPILRGGESRLASPSTAP